MRTDLTKFSTGDYSPGPLWKIFIWHWVNYYLFNSAVPWPYRIKRGMLRLFGARIGKGVIIKTHVRIKYPWKLAIGDHSWIGESCWIDNLAPVEIGNHVALSQGCILLTGNHDYTKIDFPYRLGEIVLQDGVWIGARSVVCPGVVCRSHAVLTVNSVATRSLAPWSIHSGNPAILIRQRRFKSDLSDDHTQPLMLHKNLKLI